jgi:sugar phosphate isomerase/epimerase
MQIGFISANYVARASGYDGTEDWGYHDEATRSGPVAVDSLADWLDDVAAAGFEGVSLWTAHCDYHRADAETLAAVREAAESRGLPIYAYAGGFANPPAEGEDPGRRANWEATFRAAEALGCSHLAGGYGEQQDREIIEDMVAEFDVGFAYENHPEGSVAEIRERLTPSMGVAFDTGWAGSQELDAPAAIRDLGDDLTEVHLKDVERPGTHETCTLGDGVVDVRGCLDALDDVGFEGWVSIEHEPYDRDPTEEVVESLERVREWV